MQSALNAALVTWQLALKKVGSDLTSRAAAPRAGGISHIAFLRIFDHETETREVFTCIVTRGGRAAHFLG